jgi:hypothetical protein
MALRSPPHPALAGEILVRAELLLTATFYEVAKM